MPIHVIIADDDPIIPLLQERAVARGMLLPARKGNPVARKKLPRLVRELTRERISELNKSGDPMALSTPKR